jgi:protein AroM
MYRIGMATIGQSPRDDLVPYMQQVFTKPVEVIQKGACDDLSASEIAALGPLPGEVGIVSRLRDGSETMLSHTKVLPRMQAAVEDLVADGAQFLVILCGADWSALKSSRLIVNPGKLFPSIISALARGRRLGIIKPSAGQVEKEREKYAQLGIEAVVTAASPYGGEARLEAVREAAHFLRSRDVDLVWMTCVGMDIAMRIEVEKIVDRPIVFARTILSKVIDELIPAV